MTDVARILERNLKELKKGVILLDISSLKSAEVLKKAADYLKNKNHRAGIYVTISNSHSFLCDNFKDCELLWIDASSSEKSTKSDKVIGIESPECLTDLSISIMTACKSNHFDFLFFDSVGGLLVHNDFRMVERFFHFICNKFRETELKYAFFTLSSDMPGEVKNFMENCADKVIKF